MATTVPRREEGDPERNELIDAPEPSGGFDETELLHGYVEDLLSGPEPYESGPYTGDDNSDPGFYSDDWE